MSMADFWACSLWEFTAAVDGWNRAQGGASDANPMTGEDYDALLKKAGYT